MPEEIKGPIDLVCATCGRPGVELEAHCRWDPDEQMVVSVGLCDKGHYCPHCDGLVNVKEAPYMMTHQPLEEILNHVGWEDLHKQKYKLLGMIGDYGPHSDEAEAAQSIVNLIDAIQDYAHAKGWWVFPEET